ncbi:PucR family transcriptional regulator [Nocardia sp. alder85J]|uniref:PucR family transcriptional regulator n=1 Tax=Nocardia sp. alder85J TaxID=2862949 RepID=UPI001CD483F6|nr:helix-turn-helix domain-containing protein [Nocardia sp. alder85J]MCX4091023.1 helix-turn-helix domain-containing protein [Nocardia sp. alder85J]
MTISQPEVTAPAARGAGFPLRRPPARGKVPAPQRDHTGPAPDTVRRLTEALAACGALPSRLVAGRNQEPAAAGLDGYRPLPQLPLLGPAAARWARDNVPLDALLHAVYADAGTVLEHAAAAATPRSATRADLDRLRHTGHALGAAMRTITTTLTAAYLRELQAMAAEQHARALAAALLGRQQHTPEKTDAVPPASRYAVVAVHIPHPSRRSTPDARDEAVARLRRVHAALALYYGEPTPALLSVHGGTILIPCDPAAGDDLDALLAALDEAARLPLLAAVVISGHDGIAAAADHAHHLLDTVIRAGAARGLHRLEDLAVEYQLAQPGPGRDAVAAILDRVEDHPELMTTLRAHLANNSQRRVTALQLHIHPNTLDYRLRRIAQLTGYNPAQSAGTWRLQTALAARGYLVTPGMGPTPPALPVPLGPGDIPAAAVTTGPAEPDRAGHESTADRGIPDLTTPAR